MQTIEAKSRKEFLSFLHLRSNLHIVFVNQQKVSFEIFKFGIFIFFCPIKSDRTGNIVRHFL